MFEWLKIRIEFFIASRQIPATYHLDRITLADCPAPSRRDLSFSHEKWTQVLKGAVTHGATINSVTNVSTVNYAAIANDGRFTSYLDALAHADVDRLPAIERFVFWMNAYNALAISLIIKHEEATGMAVNSINELSSKALQVWDMPAGVVGGSEISLGEIEHHELRGKFAEPLVHFCIVCASVSPSPAPGQCESDKYGRVVRLS